MSVDAIYDRELDVENLEAHELSIVRWPDERLNKECANITRFDTKEEPFLQQLVLDMYLTMRRNDGVGLAAPQVAIMANLLIIDVEGGQPLVLVNPEILESSEDTFEVDEGCLSVPGYYEKRERANSVVVRYQNTVGDTHEAEFRGIWAFVVQHEIDHLRGKVFVDDLSRFKKERVKNKMKKFLRTRKRLTP